MDVRIGNDIHFTAASSMLSEYGNIKKIHVMYINLSHVLKSCSESFPHSCKSSEYTIHGCGIPMHNVTPANQAEHMHCPHNCGFCVYSEDYIPNEGEDISLYFPASRQILGVYKVVFELHIEDEHYENNTRIQTIDFGVVFKLTHHATSCGTTIELQCRDVKDLFVTTLTDYQLEQIGTNYLLLISSASQYDLTNLPQNKVNVHVPAGNNRVIVISDVNSLYIGYQIFEFPMRLIKCNDMYIYVSEYTYSGQDLDLTIVNTNISRNPINRFPWEKDDEEETPDEPVYESTPTYFDDYTLIAGDDCVLIGDIFVSSNGVLTNNNLTL